MIDEDIVFEPEIEPSSEDGTALDGTQKIKQLKEKIKLLEKEKTEYLDGWQRARADYANLQKSTDEDKKGFREHFTTRFVEDLLPVIDSFNMAMGNSEAWEKVDPNWRTGVEYIYNQMMGVLENHGLELFGETGDAFDPTRYEAVAKEPTEEQSKDHTVAKVIQKGFLLNKTSIIRPARVVVFTKKSQE